MLDHLQEWMDSHQGQAPVIVTLVGESPAEFVMRGFDPVGVVLAKEGSPGCSAYPWTSVASISRRRK